MSTKMTREEKLYSMRMVDLAEVAEKLGVKIDKKGKKSKAVEKILAFEKSQEEVAGDGSPLAEVGKEIARQAKEKAKKSIKKEKKNPVNSTEKNRFVSDFLKYLKSKNLEVKEWEKIPNLYAVKFGKKTICELYMGKKSYRLNFKANGVEVNHEYTVVNNYYLPISIKGVDYSSVLYQDILEASIN